MRFLLIVLLFLSVSGMTAQARLAEAYIERYKDIAVNEMYRTGIPASIKLAQGMLESGFGQSELAVSSNNHFGIKCHKSWEGERFLKHDDEYCEAGQRKESCFRVYTMPEESFYDHSEFLKAKRYAFLYEYDSKDYVSWANGLLKAGYATDPQYANKLIGMIGRYELHAYDTSLINPSELIVAVPDKQRSDKNEPQKESVVQKTGVETKDNRILDIFRKKKTNNKSAGDPDRNKEKDDLAYIELNRRNKVNTQNEVVSDNSEYLFDEPLTPVRK